MAEHEPSIGLSSDWRSPPDYFEKIGLRARLRHRCRQPRSRQVLGAGKTVLHNRRRWPEAALAAGVVDLHPPFGGRNGHVPWLKRFLSHANGIAIVRAYTSSAWFHEHVVPRAELLCFPRGKTQFIAADGSVGKQPGHGVVLIGMGEVACTALLRSGLGFCARIIEPGRVQPMTAAPPYKTLTHEETVERIFAGERVNWLTVTDHDGDTYEVAVDHNVP